MAVCLTPILIRNKACKHNVDKMLGVGFDDAGNEVPYKIQVPCGKCYICQQRRRRDWYLRLSYELMRSSSCYFVTLTYDDEHLPLLDPPLDVFPTLRKRDIQLFLKRLRRHDGSNTIRYFFCGEYGPRTFRPHYHGILFNCTGDVVRDVLSCWSLGNVRVDEVSAARMMYVSKYCVKPAWLDKLKSDYDDKIESPFMVCSQGIGENMITKSVLEYAGNTGKMTMNAQNFALPRYIMSKLPDDVRQLIVDLHTEYIAMFGPDGMDEFTLKLQIEENSRKLQKLINKSKL